MEQDTSSAEHVREEEKRKLGLEIAAVERAIQRAQSAISQQRLALMPDTFGRVPAAMSPSLRAAYETGSWKSSKVYMWNMVLQHSQEGHSRAKAAHNGLAYISYRPPGALSAPLEPVRVEHSKAVTDAVTVANRIRDTIKSVLTTRKKNRNAKMRALTREYMQKRKEWSSQLARLDAEKSPITKAARVEEDRKLLVATRATNGMGAAPSVKDTTQMFREIEQAGGTAGGLERWSRSITAIPDHNMDILSPAADGGGVLIEDPLEEHYRARTINPWTKTERLLFLEKYLVHGKNFRRIANFFEYKTVEDIVRFYFDNKLPLKLKVLPKDSTQKRRAIKKNNLIDLSKLPVESRSIRDNFIHQRTTRLEEPETMDEEKCDDDFFDCHPAGKGWTSREEQLLITGLCCVDVSGGNAPGLLISSWTKISGFVKSKTPVQCRQFYEQYKTLRGLERYVPQKQTPLLPEKRGTPDTKAGPDVEQCGGISNRKQAKLMPMETGNAQLVVPMETGGNGPLVVQQRASSSVAM